MSNLKHTDNSVFSQLLLLDTDCGAGSCPTGFGGKEKDSIYSDHFILSSLHFWNRGVFLWEDKLFFKDTHIKLKDGRLVHICPRNSYYSIYSGIFVF